MNNLYFLIGLPRSGKSTIAQNWLDYDKEIEEDKLQDLYYQQMSDKSRVVVCADDIRLTLTGQRFNPKIEQYVDAIKHTMIETLLKKHDVLVDGTHTTKHGIEKLYQIHPDAHYYLINTHPDICKERAIKSKQEDLIPIIDRMYENLQEFTHSRRNWGRFWEDIVYELPNALAHIQQQYQ